MIRQLFSGNFNFTEILINLCATTFVVFCTLPIHEYAHAWAATKLGDDTARLQGRLTINPLAHLSFMGTLMIFLFGFGYAKPVPVNINRFKNRKRDFALTALAGPISNLIMAFIFFVLVNFVFRFAPATQFFNIILSFFVYAAMININLAVFNLLPIPPLDGSRILGVIIPDRYYYMIMQYERYIMMALMILLFTGALTTPLSYLSDRITRGMLWLTGLPFGQNLSQFIY